MVGIGSLLGKMVTTEELPVSDSSEGDELSVADDEAEPGQTSASNRLATQLRRGKRMVHRTEAVSYTHLTLPTIYSV